MNVTKDVVRRLVSIGVPYPQSCDLAVIAVPVDAAREVPATRSLLTFFARTSAWSWGLLGIALGRDSPAAANALSMASRFGPSLTAVTLVFYTQEPVGLRFWVARCLQWRISWRGFALPALQAPCGRRVACVLLGVVWVASHVSLFYSARNLQSDWPFGWLALSIAASSVLFAWLFDRSEGSLVPMLARHAGLNARLMIVPVTVLPDGSNLRLTQFFVGILALTALALLLLGKWIPSYVVVKKNERLFGNIRE